MEKFTTLSGVAAPLDMMNTETGARLVEETLYQIDYGLFS